MSALETKIPSFIDGVEVRRLQGRYPMEIRAFRRFDKATFIAGAASLLHLYRAVTEGRRQTTSFVTVAGNCVSSPRNYEVTIGTTVGQLLDRCGLVCSLRCWWRAAPCEGCASTTLNTPPSVRTPAPSWPSIWTVRNSFTAVSAVGAALRPARQDSIPASSTAASPPATSRRPSPGHHQLHRLRQLQLHLPFPSGSGAQYHPGQSAA